MINDVEIQAIGNFQENFHGRGDTRVEAAKAGPILIGGEGKATRRAQR